MLVGTSRVPFDGEMKPMASCYQKIVLIPRPDYASRHRTYTTVCAYPCNWLKFRNFFVISVVANANKEAWWPGDVSAGY